MILNANTHDPKPAQVLEEDNFDTLTVIDMGEALSLAQVDEDGDLQDVIIGREQARLLIEQLQAFVA